MALWREKCRFLWISEYGRRMRRRGRHTVRDKSLDLAIELGDIDKRRSGSLEDLVRGVVLR